MQIDIKTIGFKKLVKLLEKGVQEPIEQAIVRVGNKMETTAKKNLQKSVYQSTPSPLYNRTRKALQSIVLTKLSALKAKVYMGVKYGRYLEEGTGLYHDPGARTEWWGRIPALANSKRKDKGIRKIKGMKPRPFWYKAEAETLKYAHDILLETFDEYLSKNK